MQRVVVGGAETAHHVKQFPGIGERGIMFQATFNLLRVIKISFKVSTIEILRTF